YQVSLTLPQPGRPGSISENQAIVVDGRVPRVKSARATHFNSKPRLLKFQVVFTRPVTQVQATAFKIKTSGALAGASVTRIVGSGTTYTVEVRVGGGTGTVTLWLAKKNRIKDLIGNPLGLLSGEDEMLAAFAVPSGGPRRAPGL